MYVTPDQRGHGLGRLILQCLEHDATAAGMEYMRLETGRDNLAALRLYQAVGYQPIDSYHPGRNPENNRAFARHLTSWSRAT